MTSPFVLTLYANRKIMIRKEQILANLGFDSLTSMQQRMESEGKKPGGIVLLSPTGTGKTLAYLLPLVEKINVQLDVLQAVVIVPTRELAQQSEEVFKRMKTEMRCLALYGGRPAMEEHRKIREIKPQLVFATPGRLNDHLGKDNINAFGVKTLVIDEFDKCLELGFQDEMLCLLKYFSNIVGAWLLSATDAEEIPAFMGKLFQEYNKIDFLIESDSLPDRVEVNVVNSPQKDKLETLARLLTHIAGAPAIVFVSYRESVERVWHWLRQQGFAAEMYHGGMEQENRERALYKFRCGAANVLVSTDLAARGLDIPEVRVVIHYHLPLKSEDYTHRNGRTARWKSAGSVCLLVGPTEILPNFVIGQKTLDLNDVSEVQPVAPMYATIYIGRGKRDKLSKGDVLGFLCKKGGLRSDEIGRIDVGPHYAYAAVLRSKLKGMLRRVGGEKIKGMKTLIDEMRR